ncbi:MAG: hypothetical protein ACK4PI_02060 [Tepidisphaerales bacterium]
MAFAFARQSALLAAALLVSTASSALANTVTAKFTGPDTSRGQNVTVNFMNSFAGETTYTSTTVFAGALNWTTVGSGLGWSTSLFPTPATFQTFCIEFTQNITTNQTVTYQIENLAAAPKPFGNPPGNPGSPGMGGQNGLGTTRSKDTLIRQLFNEFGDSLGTTKAKWAAFQVAIWKIVFETNTVSHAGGFTDVTQGNFQINPSATAVVSHANSFLSFLVANPGEPLRNGLHAFTNDSAQDQVFLDNLTPASSSPVVPVPTAAAAGLALMGGLGVRRLRRD